MNNPEFAEKLRESLEISSNEVSERIRLQIPSGVRVFGSYVSLAYMLVAYVSFRLEGADESIDAVCEVSDRGSVIVVNMGVSWDSGECIFQAPEFEVELQAAESCIPYIGQKFSDMIDSMAGSITVTLSASASSN